MLDPQGLPLDQGFSIETKIPCKTQNLTMTAVAQHRALAFSTFSKLSSVSPGDPSGNSFERRGTGCISGGQPGTGTPLAAEAVPQGGAK